MNYYQHHIGDFDRATRHLTRLERSIYRDLIELYYDTEQPLSLDRAALCRKIIARSNEEVTAVEQTLNEFFTETPTGWYHERCEVEIGRYHNSTSQKAQAGKASALKRAAKKQQALDVNPTDVERTLNGTATNQEPRTNNQEPVKTQRKKRADDFDARGELVSLGVAETVATDFLAIRKKKRAPLTETALAEIQREAVKAGLTLHKALEKCCARGWQGFEASWLQAGGNSGEASYNSDAMAVIASYNTKLASIGWPEAVVDPYSQARSTAIAGFIAMRTKDGWIEAYFDWMANNLPAKPGYGFDWVIKTETVLRAREGNFQALKEAA